MSAEKLCNVLEEMGYGDGHLDPDSFEWPFQYEETRPLMEWMCNHLRVTNVLAVQELQAFNQVVSEGKVLEGEDLDAAFESISAFEPGWSAADAVLGIEESIKDIRLIQEESGDVRIGRGALVGFVHLEQVLATLVVDNKTIVSGVGVFTRYVKELVRGDKGWGRRGKKFLETEGWRGRRRSGGTILAFHPHKVGGPEVLNGELGGVERGNVEVVIGGRWSGVVRGDVMEEAGAGGSGRELMMGVEESIVMKHAREEVSKVHVGFVGEGGCKIFVAYSLDAGDERKVMNDGGGEVMGEGADVLDEAVIEKVGPLEEGVTRSSIGAAVADFGHPPFGGIAEEAGGGNGKPVDKGHVVELERVLELGKEEENVPVGKAEEGHDVGGSDGTGDFPFAGNNPGEGVEVEVIGGSVIAGVIKLVVVVKEVVGGKLWLCVVNPEGWRGGMGGWVFSPMACWPTSSRWMSAMESSRRELMLRREAPSSIGEDEGEVAEEDGAVEVVAEDVIAAAVVAAAARWEVLVWHGGMWRRGGQFLFRRVERQQVI
ncbi:hypothetical protein CBR_g49514 [Chara braunii]|uniref:HAUS augmin-like complex subunit 3 N-terminal domain-containing protein n=1 Tax=Chara braunii TaxID=69332 RepID=A0A388K515_CHABU|nr:hypothetical protein CBR_g49514 [Chara braunii]|eukprot:GBG65152.1 hypothetical protein CBR_g49514 [Chara braunii]